jgi:hypothetical protein
VVVVIVAAAAVVAAAAIVAVSEVVTALGNVDALHRFVFPFCLCQDVHLRVCLRAPHFQTSADG